MCGIFGFVAKNRQKYSERDVKKILEVLFKLSESRGKEAAGLAIKTESSVDISKSPVSASKFLKSAPYKEIAGRVFSVKESGFLAVLGHSRLVTHGGEEANYNNQPIIKGNALCVHNGIIANDGEIWNKFPELKREYQVDTEVFLDVLRMFLRQTGSLARAIGDTFDQIEGSASVAGFFNNNYSLFLATNTGSLYFCFNREKDAFVFVSERYMLERFIKKINGIAPFDENSIEQLKPGIAMALDLKNFKGEIFNFQKKESPEVEINGHPELKFADHSENSYKILLSSLPAPSKETSLSEESKKAMMETWEGLYAGEKALRRCIKCLLPETMTFIDFDKQGVCSYCRNHERWEIKGEAVLEDIVSKYRRADGQPDCIVPFSGGRDSSYGLYYVKKILKMNPVAYTFDWGVLTDLGRRNEARVCGKLGVEHIIISADIRRKRDNVRKNIGAWLKKPVLGMIPLLMAGDKELLHHAEWLKKQLDIKLVIYSYGNGLEDDMFKIGFSGIKMSGAVPFQRLPVVDKARIAGFYGLQYLLNPGYINSSLFDTLFAYYSVFALKDDNVHLFNYIKWEEKELIDKIVSEYGWEKEKDTVATWRIDDGTAAFYNYVYMTVAGFTEFDTFRSAQIREGQMTREEAFRLIKEENRPRFGSVEWYGRTIGFDINEAIGVINSMPKLYNI